MTFDSKGRVTKQGANEVSLAFSPATGSFTGSFVDPSTGKTVSFQGVVLQQQNVARGFFLGLHESGSVIVEPAP